MKQLLTDYTRIRVTLDALASVLRDARVEHDADLANVRRYINNLRSENTRLRKERAALKAQLTEAHDVLVDVMTQSCWQKDGYDTMCLSAYEGAAEYLVSVGLFVDCNREPEEGEHCKVMRFYKDAAKGGPS